MAAGTKIVRSEAALPKPPAESATSRRCAPAASGRADWPAAAGGRSGSEAAASSVSPAIAEKREECTS